MNVQLHLGDCLEVLAGLPENSVDTCITDPPYHLTSIVKRFGSETAGEFELGSATTQLIVFAFKFGMQPLPVVAGFLVIILIAQYGNDIQNRKPPVFLSSRMERDAWSELCYEWHGIYSDWQSANGHQAGKVSENEGSEG